MVHKKRAATAKKSFTADGQDIECSSPEASKCSGGRMIWNTYSNADPLQKSGRSAHPRA